MGECGAVSSSKSGQSQQRISSNGAMFRAHAILFSGKPRSESVCRSTFGCTRPRRTSPSRLPRPWAAHVVAGGNARRRGL